MPVNDSTLCLPFLLFAIALVSLVGPGLRVTIVVIVLFSWCPIARVVRGQVLNDSIVLIIADTGIGIAPESLRRLGKPFEQVESQLTKSYQGSGLGLAIARSLTGLHGGTMKLRSKLGAGTVVRVTLPRDASKGKKAA